MANRSISNALTDTKIKSSKAQEKAYTLPDGNGLQLLIKTNGSKIWEVRYTLHSKARKTTLGTYPDVSLADARKKRDDYKQMALKGIDPVEAKREVKKLNEAESNGQFHLVVRAWNDSLTCAEITKTKLYRMFERDVFPFFCKYDKEHNVLSSRHIKDITHSELLHVISTKRLTAEETAKRIFQESQRVWKYAIAHEYTDTLITLKIDRSVLPKPEAEHMAKITDEKILKELLNKIDVYHGNMITRFLLKFVFVIPLRAKNLCNLQWEQVDLEKGIITIPRAEMKIKDKNLPDFMIILPHQIVDLLKEVYQITGWGKWVFHGAQNIHAHVNEETANKALRLMGFTDKEARRKQTIHSFRGTFRSLVETHRQKHNKPFEVMERCLDHHEANVVARAYSHQADYSEQMGELFQWWNDYLDDLKKQAI